MPRRKVLTSFTPGGLSWRPRKADLGFSISRCQGKSHDRITVNSFALFQLLQQGGFQVVRIGLHFTGGNFLVGSSLKTELAHSQAFFRTHWRTEDATGHRTRIVKLTRSAFPIERGADLIIAKIGKTFFGLAS